MSSESTPEGNVKVPQPETETKTKAVVEMPAQEGVTATIKTSSATAEVKIARVDDDGCPKPPCPESPKWWQTWLLGAYLLLLFLVLGYLLLKLWIRRDGDELWLFWGLFRRQLQEESRLLAIVIVAGALGGYFHTVKSFVAFVGNRTIYINWFLWYILNPVSGIALATVFYFVLRAGLITGQVSTDTVSIYGVAALAGLAGMFSDQASLKLKDVFTSLFSTVDNRKDKLDKTAATSAGIQKPVIKSLSKEEIKIGTDSELTITGENFVKESVVNLTDKPVKTVFVSPSELTISIKAIDIPFPGSYKLVVINPVPGGSSDVVKLKAV